MNVKDEITSLKRNGYDHLSTQLNDSKSNEIVFYNLNPDEKSIANFKSRLQTSKSNRIYINTKLDIKDERVFSLEPKAFEETLRSFLNSYYPVPDRKFIGITGTNGKTSCVYHLSEILAQNKIGVLSIGTLGVILNSKRIKDFGLTTPGKCELRRVIYENIHKYEYCLMEVSSHALKQERLEGIKFCCAGWTNLTQDHLDYHKTMDEYRAAKLLLLKYLEVGSKLYVSEEDLYKEIKGKNSNIFLAKNIITNDLSPELQTEFAKKNLSLCVEIAKEIEIKKFDLIKLKSVPGRFQILEKNRIKVIVDYAHTPDALKNACRGVRQSYPKSKLITVFGCGGDRDKSKRPLMAQVAEEISDIVIVTSDNPRTEDPLKIIEDVLRGFSTCPTVEVDRRKAICSAIGIANKDDVVLIAGKGHETYQEINGVKHIFDDLQVVKDYWGIND